MRRRGDLPRRWLASDEFNVWQIAALYLRRTFKRPDRMKHGDIKRALLALLLLGGTLLVYLYWQQSAEISPGVVHNAGRAYKSERKIETKWTWRCLSQRCERHLRSDSEAPTSLTTCSMLCGSTQLWPQPTGPVTLGSRAVPFFHQQLHFETAAEEPAKGLLEKSYAVFNENVVAMVRKADYWLQDSDIKQFLIKVSVTDSEHVKLKLKTDESYNLTLRPVDDSIVASIKARTFFGARHGLETLSQLIWWDEYEGGGTLKVLKGASVQDAPAFPYRGLMLDTARNFMPIDSIRKVLVGMAANKLNVFHWHISDSQSFPLLLPTVPQLAKYGAYSPESIYTPEDVRLLVQFAQERGIRVVIEVDTPAHAGNGWTWGPEAGLGDLAVCVNERPWSLYCGEPPCGQLNPDNQNVYEVLEKLYRDLLQLSDENELFHLGGDEVNLECWGQYLQRNNKAVNYTDLHDLWGDFTLKALKKLEKANGGDKVDNVIVWSSNLSKRPYLAKYLNRDHIVIQSWGASQWPDTPDLIADGYKVIISHVDAWYLDCGFGRWRETGEAACDPYRPWQTVYNHRPWQQLRLNKSLILGGEVCLWSEQLDAGSLDARLWPRSSAFAERVWSDPQVDPMAYSIQEDVYTRLNTHRERLVVRGLTPEALWPTWCSQNPGMCL